MNFTIDGVGQSISAGVTSAATALPTGSQRFTDILIYNPGPEVVFAKVGAADVVATTACMPILPGEKGSYGKGVTTHIATISPDGTQAISVFVGQGS